MVKGKSEINDPSFFSSPELPRALSFSKHERRTSQMKSEHPPDSPGLGQGPFTIQLNQLETEEELSGECYISFQKLLQEEVKLFDRKDSSFLSSAVYEQSDHANEQY